jgi:hypothetical protein
LLCHIRESSTAINSAKWLNDRDVIKRSHGTCISGGTFRPISVIAPIPDLAGIDCQIAFWKRLEMKNGVKSLIDYCLIDKLFRFQPSALVLTDFKQCPLSRQWTHTRFPLTLLRVSKGTTVKSASPLKSKMKA